MDRSGQRKRLLVYECYQTIISRSYQFIIPALVALQSCFLVLRIWKEELTPIGVYSGFLEGMPEMAGTFSGLDRFLIPGDWCIFVFFFAYIVGRSAKDYIGGAGMQLLLRTERVEDVWYVKCFVSLIQALLYVGTAYFVMFLFLFWKYGGVKEIFLPDGEILRQFVIPVLTVWVMAVWQMVISMWTNTLIGVIVTVAAAVGAAYAQRWYLIGNYLMKIRVTNLIDSGFSCGKMAACLLVFLTAGIVLGKILIRRMDYIRAKGDL